MTVPVRNSGGRNRGWLQIRSTFTRWSGQVYINQRVWVGRTTKKFILDDYIEFPDKGRAGFLKDNNQIKDRTSPLWRRDSVGFLVSASEGRVLLRERTLVGKARGNSSLDPRRCRACRRQMIFMNRSRLPRKADNNSCCTSCQTYIELTYGFGNQRADCLVYTTK